MEATIFRLQDLKRAVNGRIYRRSRDRIGVDGNDLIPHKNK